jgi:hypothetical protein
MKSAYSMLFSRPSGPKKINTCPVDPIDFFHQDKLKRLIYD